MYRAAAVLAGLTCLAGSASAETLERTVKANAATPIGGFLGYEVDTCYPSVIPNVKVRQAPANGSIQIVPHQQALGKDSRCPGKTVRGLAFVYTPKKGFKGADELSLDVPWSSTDSGPETIRTYTFRVKVE
ncbi:MAG TPA: hypothetical protein VK434_07265 [Microvirga sp.]|jgi:hypothetical protein|nr:hypothetical protein [Microvirga sp.]